MQGASLDQVQAADPRLSDPGTACRHARALYRHAQGEDAGARDARPAAADGGRWPRRARRGARRTRRSRWSSFPTFSDRSASASVRPSNRCFDTYGDQIHLRLPRLSAAEPPERASRRPKRRQCANEQGKFWPYHDRLFANQQRLSECRPEAARGGGRPRRRAIQRVRRLAQVQRGGRRRHARRAMTPASTAHPRSSSTAG